MGPPDDPRLPPDETPMGIEMALILMSLGVAPANFKVAEVFCRWFVDTAVDMGFERGLAVMRLAGTWMTRSRWRWSSASAMKSQCC